MIVGSCHQGYDDTNYSHFHSCSLSFDVGAIAQVFAASMTLKLPDFERA